MLTIFYQVAKTDMLLILRCVLYVRATNLFLTALKRGAVTEDLEIAEHARFASRDAGSVEGAWNGMRSSKRNLIWTTFATSVEGIQLHLLLWRRIWSPFYPVEEYLLLDHRGEQQSIYNQSVILA
jgi:hypothetical protein